MLTTAHEPLIKAPLNHISPYFADVVWTASTMHVRETLEGNVTLDELRDVAADQPAAVLERVAWPESCSSTCTT